MDSLSPALADRLGPLLGRAHEAHRALAHDALAPLGLTPKGYGALALLAVEGPLSQQRAVERSRDPGDRRAYALQLTRQGGRLLGRAEAAVVGAEERFLAPLPTAEQRRLKSTLRRLLAR